jgi:mannose-6-phosphate isomerase-like protein (cupin superfamily)
MRIWRQVGRDTGAQAISLRTLEFARGESPQLRNPHCDEVMYVLEGEGNIAIDGEVYHVEPETGLYIRPGQSFSVWNPGSEPIVLISSRCPEPESEPAVDSSARGWRGYVSGLPGVSGDVVRERLEYSKADLMSSRPATESAAGKAGPLVRLADREAMPTGDRWYRVLVDDEVGSTQVTQFIGSIPPGRAPDHFHLYEEVLFILRGEGRMWAGKTSTPIEAGSCAYLPRKQSHCVENTGTGELRLLGVFYPAGSPAVRYDTDP